MPWPKTALNQLVAHREAKGAPPKRAPRADIEGVLRRSVGASLQGLRPSDARFSELPRSVVSTLFAVCDAYASPLEIPVLDVEGEQWMLALARAGYAHFGRPGWPGVVDRWVELRGARFACEVLVGAGRHGLGITGMGDELKWRLQVQVPSGEELIAFTALRESLAHADEAPWQEALRFAERHRRNASLPVREKLAYAFAQPAWAREDLDATLAALPLDAPVPPSTLALLSVLDAPSALRLVEIACPRFSLVRTLDTPYRFPVERWDDQRLPGLAAHVFDLAARVGESAVPVIDLLLRTAYAQDKDGPLIGVVSARYGRPTLSRRSAASLRAAVASTPALIRRLGLALSLFETDAAAAVMAERLGQKDLDKLTTEYFRAHPQLAIRHLAERAKKKSGVGEHARTLLEEAERLVQREAPMVQAERPQRPVGLPTALARLPWRKRKTIKTDAALDPRYFDGLPERVPAMPRWISVDALPPLVLCGGETLPSASVGHVLEMLRFSTVDAPYIGVLDLHDALEPASRVAFARALHASFRANDHKEADFWPVRALGALGGIEVLDDLLEVLDAVGLDGWEGSAERVAATEGLVCIGDAEALHLAFDRSRTLGHPAARADVRAVLEAEAKRRGISDVAFALASIPTRGFDERRSRRLEGGRFTITLDHGLDLRIAEGSIPRAELPAHATDEERAALASLRVSVARIRASLTRWLEDRVLGMDVALTRRDFEALVRHPIAGVLIARLVWSVRGSGETFRVAEDRSFASIDDASMSLGPEAQIRLAHPAELDAETLARWQEVWASYELLTPFPQLDRPVARDGSFDALFDQPLDPAALPRLFAQGWEPEGGVSKRGRIGCLARVLSRPEGTFVLAMDVVPPLRTKDARIEAIRLVRAADEGLARRSPALVGKNGEVVPLEALDLRTRSEVAFELDRLLQRSKAER